MSKDYLIKNRRKEIIEEIEKYNKDIKLLEEECNHELVLKYGDHALHKVGKN